jgi:hypothetical protein
VFQVEAGGGSLVGTIRHDEVGQGTAVLDRVGDTAGFHQPLAPPAE